MVDFFHVKVAVGVQGIEQDRLQQACGQGFGGGPDQPIDIRAKLQLAGCQQRLGLLEEALDTAYAAIHPQHRGETRDRC